MARLSRAPEKQRRKQERPAPVLYGTAAIPLPDKNKFADNPMVASAWSRGIRKCIRYKTVTRGEFVECPMIEAPGKPLGFEISDSEVIGIILPA